MTLQSISLADAMAEVARCGGNVSQAARNLRINRWALRRLLERTELSAAPVRSPDLTSKDFSSDNRSRLVRSEKEPTTGAPMNRPRKVAIVSPETAELLSTLRRKLTAHHDREINEADLYGKIVDRYGVQFCQEQLQGDPKAWSE